ncbi:Crp/Fnr family transcriptional regulator [Jiella marina]|uniref:Crp/Fnr family transcriptional regulator n=1 Tax=Jiella sp. LLJ827 TaxID=2917712 RepID=UPI0021006AF5|nr:Crp/Fnr family transcriptional regulator [Jiella sp. LLJ827]
MLGCKENFSLASEIDCFSEAVFSEPEEKMKAHIRYRPLIRNLRSTTEIAEEGIRQLLELPMIEQEVDKGYEVVHEGDHPTRCCLVLEGFAFRYRILVDGSRQIVAFNVPGDLPDLQSLHLKRMDHALATLSPARLAFIPHGALRDLTRKNYGVADALWRRTLIDAAILREWVTALGRKPAPARIAHILCELMARLSIVQLGNKSQVRLPVTQNELADALGLTYVTINRTLQDFSRAGIVDFRHQVLTIHNWPELQRIAGFDPDYLHLTCPLPKWGPF